MLTQVDRIIDNTREQLANSENPKTDKNDILKNVNENNIIGSASVSKIVDAVNADILGLGPLQFLSEIPGITDILVNGPDNVWIDRGRGMEKTKIEPGKIDTPEKLRDFAFRLAVLAGARLDDSSPIVDGQLPLGYRLHAVIEPLCERGALISIRIPSNKLFTFDQFIENKTIPSDWADTI
ncbi:MAG: Flp pilus assembly complex ATPase component TadA [Bifidobacteriaceae bacterium]|jgi:pilus assembly protein CpaF|nr:Flp pilus assembly complex ATPase component TadA [Bifidobacteriaceae bacterium]